MFSPEIYRNKERNNYMHHFFFFQKQNEIFFAPEIMADHVGNLPKKKKKRKKNNEIKQPFFRLSVSNICRCYGNV